MSDQEVSQTLPSQDSTLENSGEKSSRNKLWLIIILVVIVLGSIITGIVFLSGANSDITSRVRDIFIILMALESLVIGVALVVLVIQLASLINLLQNEIKPILKTTSDTVNTLKGTTEFLSNNLANPVIKLNSSLAGAKKLLNMISLFKK